MLRKCFKIVSKVFEPCFNIASKFSKHASELYKMCFKCVPRLLRKLSNVLQSCFKVACFRVVSIYKKEISRCQIRKCRRMSKMATIPNYLVGISRSKVIGFWLFKNTQNQTNQTPLNRPPQNTNILKTKT